MVLPPGQIYLLRNIPRLLAPSLLVYAALHVLSLPSWLAFILAALTFPAQFFIPVIQADLKNEKRRQALGADHIPFVRDAGFLGLKVAEMITIGFDKIYPSDYYGHLPEVYGTIFRTRLMLQDMVVTLEPAHVKAVLATQFDNFEKGPISTANFRPLLGNGIFNVDGEIWKFHRGLTRPFFARDRITDFDIFERYADQAISVIRTRLNEDKPVDFQDMIGRFALDSALSFLLGKEMSFLSLPLPYPPSSGSSSQAEVVSPDVRLAESFLHSFGLALKITAVRQGMGASWPLAEMWEDKLAPHMAVIHNFVEPIVQTAIGKKKEGSERDEEDTTTLLDELVRQTDDYILIRDETINMLVAGKDTTSGTLTFIIYMLAEHPHVLMKLRQEILDHVGPDRTPTYDDVKSMKYLRAVINETLRLYPTVPFDARWSVNATTFEPTTPGGKPLFVPPGAVIVYSVFYMHRRKDLWGPDALEFDPERFIDSRVQKYLVPNPYIFVPFNAGPRICLGQQFAYNQMSFFLIRLLQSFSSISLDLDARPESCQPPEAWKSKEGRQSKEKLMTDVHLTMFFKEALWVRMKEAMES